MVKIITHPGSAHFDEFLAISMILGKFPNEEFEIERKIPTEEELNDPTIWVIDIGNRYEPSNLNFDHHQDNNLDCSFSLIAKHFNIENQAREIFKWWDFKNQTDLLGIKSAGEKNNIPIDKIECCQSPIEDIIIYRFSTHPERLLSFMRLFGEGIFNAINEKKLQFALFDNSLIESINEKFSYLYIGNYSTKFLNLWLEKHPEIIIILVDDDRFDGYKLQRVNVGEKIIDFQKIIHLEQEIAFVHNTGFLAVTSEKLPWKRIKELIQLTF